MNITMKFIVPSHIYRLTKTFLYYTEGMLRISSCLLYLLAEVLRRATVDQHPNKTIAQPAHPPSPPLLPPRLSTAAAEKAWQGDVEGDQQMKALRGIKAKAASATELAELDEATNNQSATESSKGPDLSGTKELLLIKSQLQQMNDQLQWTTRRCQALTGELEARQVVV